MKISFVITKAEAGGAQSHVAELIDGVRCNHQVCLATGEEGWLTEQARSRDVPVTIIPDLVHPIRPLQDVRACRQVKEWLLREQPDLLHAHSSKAGLVGRIAARMSGIPSVFTAHGWAFTDGATMARKLVAMPSEWLAARTGGDIICVSNYDRNLARRYALVPDWRLHTVWNGIADTVWRSAAGCRPELVITMVARFAAPKDHATVLEAIAEVTDQPWRLRLIGDGPLLAESKVLASSLGIEGRVEFTGLRTDVETLLAQSDVFVLSSRFEGLPISIIEAMRAGLPVVASDVGGVSELVDAATGILVPAGDVAGLAGNLRRLLCDTELRARLGAGGRRKFEMNFRASSMIQKTLGVYDACLRRHGRETG